MAGAALADPEQPEPPSCTAALRAEAGAWDWIACGRAHLTLGSLDRAAEAFATAERLAREAGAEREIGVALIGIGDAKSRTGDRAGARAAYTEALAIARRLAAADPKSAEWQRNVSVGLERIGDLLATEGDRAGALAAFGEGLDIARRLAASDPKNAGWQRDVTASLIRIGALLAAEGDRAGALAAFQEGLDIRRRLAAADPKNAEWQRDVSVSLDRVGALLAAEGDRAGALAAFQDGLAIARRLAAADPKNAEWQRDLIVSHAKLAGADPGNAVAHWQDAHRIAAEMQARGILAPVDAWIPGHLADQLEAARAARPRP